ncbi:hypothetical protein PQQ75_11940 [Paraburkholderia aspalathi]|uniref:hypothetical protein n=1 Tax=Paraburkholderia aspalathi TaxID=1324617 RepID=UPI0038B8D801
MAQIVAVHGIGQQRKGADTLHSKWLPALRDGLRSTGRELPAGDDLRCAFYGDLFRPKGKSMDPPYTAADVEDGDEAALLQAWWAEAVQLDSRIPGPDAPGKASTPQLVQGALRALTLLPFFKSIAQPAMIYDLKQVRLYMNDDAIRAEVQARVVNAICEDTRVLIGHSLGSVVAYEALCANPEWKIRTFVTVGSPLGIGSLIFKHLRPAPQNGKGAWPGSVERWFNISDAGDVVALVKKLAPLFGRERSIQDISISNGATAHDIEPYLTAAETGHAIATGL